MKPDARDALSLVVTLLTLPVTVSVALVSSRGPARGFLVVMVVLMTLSLVWAYRRLLTSPPPSGSPRQWPPTEVEDKGGVGHRPTTPRPNITPGGQRTIEDLSIPPSPYPPPREET